MVDSLGTLLSRSTAFFQKNIVPIVVASLVAGVVMLVISLAFGRSVLKEFGGGLGDLNANRTRMEDLQRRVQAGDPAALQEIQQEAQKAMGALTGNPAGIASTARFGMLAAILVTIVSLVLNGYILLLVVDGRGPKEALTRLGAVILPFLGLMIWVFIRTFAWIPLIGIVTAIILGPRFVAAPVLLVKEKKGVLESAKISYAQTGGLWGKIFGNLIAVAICTIVVAWAVNFVLSIVLRGASFYVGPFVSALAGAYLIVFMTYLSLAILEAKRV
ncbi:MAG: hypothetical protein WCS85_05335 [Candidatus Peribacteraceae bacterium]|jgi:hypothetical protein